MELPLFLYLMDPIFHKERYFVGRGLYKRTSDYIRYEYRWADGVQIKKPIEVLAPKYVEYLMDWIESQLDDEALFPQRLVVCEELSMGLLENKQTSLNFSSTSSWYFAVETTMNLMVWQCTIPGKVGEAELAQEKTNGYKLNRAHVFVVNMFDEIKKFMKVPDEWAPPETKPYTSGVSKKM